MASKRPSAAQRGYGPKWKAAREAFLEANPWCVMCAQRGVRTRSTRVDHIEPHRGDFSPGGLFWSRSNWQALCGTDHDATKQKQEKSGFLRGCDADGRPLDATHHWNRKDGQHG